MKRISVLGSTGSIGTQTLDVVRRHRGLFRIAALTAGKNIDLFRKQLAEFSPQYAAVSSPEDAKLLSREFPSIDFSYGLDGINKIAADNSTGMTVNALVGSMGIAPTYEAVKAGKTIAFANKETLAAGGELIMRSVKEYGARLLPVDSEHSAIFQSMQASPGAKVKRIILTASGGPFRGWSKEQLKTVTREQALHHPNWNMGPKVTIDSSTMMNKGLEVIEAYWLFGVPYENIEVVVHPESILHSAVEFEDGCIIGQMGCADMRMPIAYALSYPERLDNIGESLDLFKLGAMHFEKPDLSVFRCLALTFEAIKAGNGATAALNAANEEAVRAFLEDKIEYYRIPELCEEALQHHEGRSISCLEDIYEIENKTRGFVKRCLG